MTTRVLGSLKKITVPSHWTKKVAMPSGRVLHPEELPESDEAGPGAGSRNVLSFLPTDKTVGLTCVLETAMNLTEVRANENCDGDASTIATVAELSARFVHELNE